MSPTLADGFFISEPPGKPPRILFLCELLEMTHIVSNDKKQIGGYFRLEVGMFGVDGNVP